MFDLSKQTKIQHNLIFSPIYLSSFHSANFPQPHIPDSGLIELIAEQKGLFQQTPYLFHRALFFLGLKSRLMLILNICMPVALVFLFSSQSFISSQHPLPGTFLPFWHGLSDYHQATISSNGGSSLLGTLRNITRFSLCIFLAESLQTLPICLRWTCSV